MPQHATADGRNNVIVQIAGDGNTVVGGLPHLTLVRHLKSHPPRNEIEWLIPYFRALPLLGRDRDLASLQGWLAGPAPVSVRVLTGGGGAGKTRLALELCDRVREDWDAGFVEGLELERFQGQQNLADWGWRRPTLVVVDYAAAHAQRLRAWLSELADRDPGAAAPLRLLLLLERHGAPGGGWWQSVFEQGGSTGPARAARARRRRSRRPATATGPHSSAGMGTRSTSAERAAGREGCMRSRCRNGGATVGKGPAIEPGRMRLNRPVRGHARAGR